MREIKFRAWDKVNNKMIPFSHIWFELEDGYGSVKERISETIPNVLREVDYFELMQYTGLRDKNGNDIYEGDVLKLRDYHGDRVVYIDYVSGVYYYTGDGFSDEYLFNSREREVIGNLYENPKLIEEE